jgi:predicted dehydrogenase
MPRKRELETKNMSSRLRIAYIGTGGRANSYAQYFDRERVEYVACADISSESRKAFIGLNQIQGMAEYEDWRTMFASCGRLDGVVIATPNHLHTEPAVEAMTRGMAVALEKPIAHNADACRRLLACKKKNNSRVLVGFVMRSAPFYLQAKRWIEEGRVGSVSTIQADEIVHLLTVGVMFRSPWRRFKEMSGGSLLEKCCHDIDMLTWMAGSSPVSLNSYAGVKTLGPRADLPARCDDCHITDSCMYYLPNEVYTGPARTWGNQDADLYKLVKDRGSCIYNNGHDTYDHQSVQISYDNGVLVNFLVDFGSSGKATGRTLRVLGSEGSIWGKCEENVIHCHNRRTDAVERLELRLDGSGHGGANRNHAEAFTRMMLDPAYPSPATLEAGYVSAMTCFAADDSASGGRRVDVSHLLAEAGLNADYSQRT